MSDGSGTIQRLTDIAHKETKMITRFHRILLATLASLLAVALGASTAHAAFGISDWDGHLAENSEGVLQAGGHPEDVVTTIGFNSHFDPDLGALLPDAGVRNVTVDLPPGLLGNPRAIPTCESIEDLISGPSLTPLCPLDSIVGTIEVPVSWPFPPDGFVSVLTPLFNITPPLGHPAQFGFNVTGVPTIFVASVNSQRGYSIEVNLRNASQGLSVLGSTVTFWGQPSDPSHDLYRCLNLLDATGCTGTPGDPRSGPNSVTLLDPMPFLTNPTSCSAPGEGLRFDVFAESWEQPPSSDQASFTNRLEPEIPLGTSGCDRVPFQPEITVQPTTDEADTPTGLEVNLTIPPDGLENPEGISQSHLKDAVVTLPEGMTVNPSQANGLAVCTPSEIGLTSGDSQTVRFDEAKPSCPEASQIGEVQVDTPLLEEPLEGALYLAAQDDPGTPGAENPFNSTLALYIAAEGSGVLVKLAGEVAPNPSTGQLVTRFLNNPQVPFERFALKFKGGQRAPLVTPPTCGTHTTRALLSPWASPNQPITATDSFQITKGPNGGPCPSGGVPPFHPGFTAGSLNNNAGSYSPFVMRLTRGDGEQDMTKFSATLPPGVSAKIAGVANCPEAAIAAAKAKSGREERSAPSCPPNSQIGSILAGAGAGSLQVYVGGKVYLAGPFAGAPLSAVVITPAVAGPFDIGTVVTREALALDPTTAVVHVDGEKSDPIPHILKGIPLRVRDIRVHVDRPEFTLNPTGCDPSAVEATLFGSFLDVLSPADDVPVGLNSRFQAANCSLLRFKPKLTLRLRGGTKRADHPALTAILTPRPGDANIAGASAALPRSEFLENAHIRTVCTRAQFAADACPKGAIYGRATATTPLLDFPVKGNVYLRSSSNLLPDLVADLRGPASLPIRFEVVGRTDSVNGGIRNTFDVTPDVPVTKFVLKLQGGRKGLLVNSRDICERTYRATVKFKAHNGKRRTVHPALKADCGKKRKKGKRRAH